MDEHKPFDLMAKCTAKHVIPGEPDHSHAVILAYEMQDPAAVELIFIPEMISWKFGRDLLFTAAIQGAPAGDGQAGDILIQPVYSTSYGSHLLFTIRGAVSRDAPALPPEDFVLDRRTAQKFLYATFDLVPLGEEDYSAEVDAFLHVMQLGRDS